MTFPWIPSRYTDAEALCSMCAQVIPVGTARMYNVTTKEAAHTACHGARQMGDRGSPVAPPEDRSAAIERMHKENYDAAMAIGEAVRSLKASVVETNMILSVFTEYFVKMKEKEKEAGK